MAPLDRSQVNIMVARVLDVITTKDKKKTINLNSLIEEFEEAIVKMEQINN